MRTSSPPDPATAPWAMTSPDGMVSIFCPPDSGVRVYEGSRGSAVYLPPEAWQQILEQLMPDASPSAVVGVKRPASPSNN